MAVCTLLIACTDRTGIVAALSDFVSTNRGNILDADQHSEPPADAPVGEEALPGAIDPAKPVFYMRLAFDTTDFVLNPAETEEAIGHIAKRFAMRWSLYRSDAPTKVAVFCTKASHCLYDLLMRQELGELAGQIACVVSNHEHLKPVAEHFGLPFHHVPVTPGTKAEAEAEHIRLIDEEHAIDTVVLARYMQIVSPAFCERYAGRCINIHHSFLPAFVGAKPYHQAKARGVKLIGATAHYVTADLDQGPIIEQDVIRVTHRDTVETLVQKGRDIERQVLAKAVASHLDRRVLIHGNRTIVFQ